MGFEDFLINMMNAAVLKYPWATSVLTVVGVARFFFKPVVALVQKYVEFTPGKEDDTKLAAVMASKPYRWFCFVLDWTLSIKLPAAKAPEPVAEATPVEQKATPAEEKPEGA